MRTKDRCEKDDCKLFNIVGSIQTQLPYECIQCTWLYRNMSNYDPKDEGR